MKKILKNVTIIKIFVVLLTLMTFSCSKINDILDPETKAKREEKEKIILEKCKNSGLKFKRTYSYGYYAGDWRFYFNDGSSEELERLFTVSQGNRLLKKCFENLPEKEAKEKYESFKFVYN